MILYEQLNIILDAKNLYIALYHKEKKELQFEFEIEDNKLLEKRKHKLKKELIEYVINNKKPLLIRNNYNQNCEKLGIKPSGKDAKSWLGVPLISKGEVIGIIKIKSYKKENAYDEYHLEILSTIADQATIAIENSKLYKNLEKNHKDLEKAYEDLKEMEKMKSEFLMVTSHEFGTPITIIKANTCMFLDETYGKLTEFQKKRMEVINVSVERLAKMRKQTLLLYRLDGGQFDIMKEKISLNEVIEDVVTNINILAENNQQEIITKLKACQINCNKDMMREVIENLLSNAVKYSGKKSKVNVSMKEEKNSVHITVSDNGIGIAKEHLDKIFDRFYIAHHYLTHKQGTGLGLAVVKEIVEAHGGRVICESEINKGTKFIVILPKN